LDYRRRWQQTRLRRTRQRLLIALGAVLILALIVGAVRFAHSGGAVWVYTPPQPGMVHFAVQGAQLCAVWDTGRVVGLDLSTGAELPHSEFRRAFPFLAPPLLVSGRALVGSEDGRLRCLNLRTGQALWEHRTGGAVRGQPVLLGTQVLFSSDDGYLYCVDFATGAGLWRTYCGGALGAAPAVTGDRAVVGTVGYGIAGLNVAGVTPLPPPPPAPARPPARPALPAPPPDPLAPERWLWGVAVPAPVLAPPVAYAEGKVAIGSDEGALYLLDVAASKTLARVALPGLVRLRPAALADRVIVADSSGRVCAVDFTGAPLWSRQVSDVPAAGLAASSAAVYLGTAGAELLALRPADGSLLWRRDLPAPAAGSLEVTDTLVLVGLDDGRICAFPRPEGG
jgi:outer membrane protein assembly factor BamB